MFYSHQLLARKAPLGQIWMAATMHAKINRKNLYKLNLIRICEEILNPSVPMALRLSGILMGGVVIVYERKVRLLYDDVTRLMVEINQVWKIKAVSEVPTSVSKNKTRTKREAITRSRNREENLEEIEQQLPHSNTMDFNRTTHFSMRLDNLEDPITNQEHMEEPQQDNHQVEADNITLFEKYQPDPNVFNQFERFDIEGDNDTQMIFSTLENTEVLSTVMPSPPAQDRPQEPEEILEQHPEVRENQESDQSNKELQDHIRLGPTKKRARRHATTGLDYEHIIIPGNVYQTWLQNTSDIISRRRKRIHLNSMPTKKISSLMELPPVVLTERLFKNVTGEIHYPDQLLELWMRSTEPPHDSPSGRDSTPMPPVTSSSSPVARVNVQFPFENPIEDIQSGDGFQFRGLSIEKLRTNITNNDIPPEVLMGGLGSHNQHIDLPVHEDNGLNINMENLMTTPGNSGDERRSIPSSGSGNGFASHNSDVDSGRNLGDMCIKGTLGPELGKLIHIKSIILRNNLFSGIIPVEITKLKELEMLDLRYNSFTGPLPCDLCSILSSRSIILMDHNKYINCVSPETSELQFLSEVQTDDKTLSRTTFASCSENPFLHTIFLSGEFIHRKLLQIPVPNIPRNVRTFLPFPGPPPIAPPEASPSPQSSVSPPHAPSFPRNGHSPSATPPTSPLTPAKDPIVIGRTSKSSNHHSLLLYSTIAGVTLFLIIFIGIFFWRNNKLAVVNPWATGISGQLQRAFVTGVPKLRRSELEAACEDFSNVIGSSTVGTLYKGTLSSGVEIAVMSFSVSSVKDWSSNQERQFREKIQTLSKLNHKNSVNLLGYCEEEEPFTRMMVFEYAPNGTLFEHLHIKEAEHLDWSTRMRIVMGIAYCLECMHEMTPPIAHKKLNSSAVYLTEDYAAKVSDFGIFSEAIAADMEANPANNVYSFGVLLLEIVTGKLQYSVENSMLKDWTSTYLGGHRSFTEMADPILNSFETQQLEKISEVIRSCVNPEPRRRPSMKEVTVKLREITSLGPDRAIPRLSPLWWAELEIMSAEATT